MTDEKREDGFSLIEFLLVLVIAGLLATIAVPSFMKSRDVAERASAVANLHKLHITQTGYLINNGRYATLPELNTYAKDKLGTTVGSNILNGDYTFIMIPGMTSNVDPQYKILSVKYRNRMAVSAFLIDQRGELRTLID